MCIRFVLFLFLAWWNVCAMYRLIEKQLPKLKYLNIFSNAVIYHYLLSVCGCSIKYGKLINLISTTSMTKGQRASSSRGMEFTFRNGQILHSIANGSPPSWCATQTRYTLRCNTESIMKSLVLLFFSQLRI